MSISDYRRRQPATWLLILSIAFVCAAHAQENAALPSPPQASQQSPAEEAPPAELKLLTNYVEGGGNYLALTDGFGNWTGGYARGVITQKNNIWNAEINGQREFGDAGVYFGVGDTYNFNPDWYGSLTLGSSAGGFFWPRFRADGFLNKKWLAPPAVDHHSRLRLLRRQRRPPRSQFLRRLHILLREALDPRRRDPFQRQQSRICLLSGRFRRGDTRPQPATLHHASCRSWKRGVSTSRTGGDHNGLS